MPQFWRIGLGLPFYNIVQGSRYIVLGSYNRIGRDVGVLFGWIGFLGIAPLLVILKHRRDLRAQGLLKG
jgi:hypothetical protein